jgi:uncharacterized membrane-anchored protein
MQRIASTATATILLALPLAGQDRELDFQSGTVSVKGGIATIQLPDGYTYLQQGDARYVVEDLWENVPDETVIGLVMPPDPPTGEESTWAIIVSYVDDGYVSDDDASSIDFNALLAEMQSDARKSADDLRAQGYASAELLNWAEPPHYDPVGKKLYWAQRLLFDGDTAATLNYNVRILGRRGYLLLNAVADDGILPTVSAGSKEILGVTEFTAGNRYEEFDPSYDKLAAYGVGGLIAGKLLAKAGILKVLLKPMLVLLALLGGGLFKLFGGSKRREVVPATQSWNGPRRDRP